MSYTERDWLGEQVREGGPFDREAETDLLVWMEEDRKAVVSVSDMDALVGFVADSFSLVSKAERDRFIDQFDDGNDDVRIAFGHWMKNRRDWVK